MRTIIMSLLNGMRSLRCLVLLILLLPAKQAFLQEMQKPGSILHSAKRSPDTLGLNPSLPDWDNMAWQQVIDSLNKRKIHGKTDMSTRIGSQFNVAMDKSPFANLKDSVTGEFLYYIQYNFGVSKLNKVIKGMQASRDTGAFQDFIGQKLKGFYAMNGKDAFHIPSFQNIFQNNFKGASYKVFHQNQEAIPTPWIHQLQVSDNLMLMDIPFQLEFSNLTDRHLPLRDNNPMKFSFDKDGFQNGMRQKLDKYYNIEKYLLNDVDALSLVKQHFNSEITSGIQSLKTESINDPAAFLQSRTSMEELLKLDKDQIREKIMPASQTESIRHQIKAGEQLLIDHGSTLDATQRDSILQKMKGQNEYLASLEQMVSKVNNIKFRLEKSGINANQITRWQQATNSKTISSLKDPNTIKDAAENLLPMKGLQRFFSHVSSLNAGTFGVDQSERTLSGLFSAGLQLSALKKNNAFGAGLGTMRDGGYLKDAGLENSLFSPAQFMQFLQFGKEKNGKRSSQFTILNSNTFSPDRFRYEGMSMARNVFVGTFSKSIPVRKSGTVEAEVSKSATQFRNTIGADQVMEHKSAFMDFTNDIWQTLSLGLRYSDDWETIGLSHNAHIAYAGFGYTNPGNPSASRGALQYDLEARKEIAKNKGFIQAQFATRNYNYSADGDKRWQNMQLNLQARYRINRSLSLGGRLNQYQLVRKLPTGKEKMYVSRKVMADGQFSGNIAGIRQRSIVSLGLQQFDNVQIQQGNKSELLLAQWVTTVPAGNSTILLNIYYNKEMTSTQLIGDMFNGEAGASFPLFKTVTLTSSLTYLDNKMAARQIGTRQSLNTTIFRNCSVNVYADWRKDLIESVNPYLYSNFRGELSIFYQIK